MIQESSEFDGNEAEAQHLILSTVKSKKSPVEEKDRWSMDTVCALDPKTEIKRAGCCPTAFISGHGRFLRPQQPLF